MITQSPQRLLIALAIAADAERPDDHDHPVVPGHVEFVERLDPQGRFVARGRRFRPAAIDHVGRHVAPVDIEAVVEERDEQEIAHAISCHYTKWGVSYETLLDKALLACDELTGLILACAYVRPDRDLRSVRLKSVKKKWKDKAFTAAINRQENMEFIEALGEPFDEHLQRVLESMQGAAVELGVAGEESAGA